MTDVHLDIGNIFKKAMCDKIAWLIENDPQGRSQRAIARDLGFTNTTLINMKNGLYMPDGFQISRLNRVFGLEAGELITIGDAAIEAAMKKPNQELENNPFEDLDHITPL